MNINLFKLALDRLKPSDWEDFERLASDFLAAEFTNLRTMAHPSGDGGRDSELFSPMEIRLLPSSTQYRRPGDRKSMKPRNA
jgi:hypothetical protein